MLPTNDTTPIELELVEQLLRAKQPDSILYINELPGHLHSIFPLPAEAEILAATEQPQKQWMTWLNVAGSATDAYSTTVRQLEATGWRPVPTANFSSDAGFMDSGFHEIAPITFSHIDNPNKRLRLWTVPVDESSAIVEMLIDFLPNGRAYSFEPRKPASGEQVESYPMLSLSPPPDSAIYFSSHRIGLWEWSSRAEIFSADSAEQLAAHYKTQLIAAGWQAASNSQWPDDNVSLSSWNLSDKDGKVWQALLQIAMREKENSYAASLQVITLNPSFA